MRGAVSKPDAVVVNVVVNVVYATTVTGAGFEATFRACRRAYRGVAVSCGAQALPIPWIPSLVCDFITADLGMRAMAFHR